MKALDTMTAIFGGTDALRLGALVGAVFLSVSIGAQTPPSAEVRPAPQPPADGGALAPLAWLEGCWRGSVNQREYREQWMPLRGNLLVGVSQTVVDGKTQGYEYLRVEPRPDGVYYVASPPGKPETAFRLVDASVDRMNDRNDQIFTFANPALDFPQKIVYRRGSEGWLYAAVEGKVGGADRQVTYPMRRIGCESGEYLLR